MKPKWHRTKVKECTHNLLYIPSYIIDFNNYWVIYHLSVFAIQRHMDTMLTMTYKGQHRIIIWTKSVGLKCPMLFTKEDFYHICAWQPSWTWTCDHDHLNKFSLHQPMEAPMKFCLKWPGGFRGADVWKCWRRRHAYTISSPMVS